MSIQNLDFGTGAGNDGEFPFTAWPKVQANFTDLYSLDRRHFTPFPMEETDSVVSPIPKPRSGFGRDFTASADLGTSLFFYNTSVSQSIGFDRTLYGTAIFHHRRESDLWQAIMNVGAAGSGTEETYGGASLQTAVFLDSLYYTGYGSYEDENEIESGGYQNLALTPDCSAPRSAAIMQYFSATRRVEILCRMNYWFARRYRNNKAAAIAAGAANDSVSDGYIQKMYSLDNIGTDAAPINITNVLATDIAYRRMDGATVKGFDILSGYHKVSELAEWYEYDPRTAVSTRTYPFQADALTVDAIALTNRPLATGFAAGQVITSPGGTNVTLVAGMKVLAAAQTTATENKVYTVPASGAPTAYSPVPTQVIATLWGIYTNTAVNTWIRTYNYGCKPFYLASADGTKAYGIYAPQIPLTGEGSNTTDGIGCGQYNFQKYPTATDMQGWEAKIGATVGAREYRVGPGTKFYKCYTVIGTKAEVISKLQSIWNATGKVLDPDVFDWTYWRDTNPHLVEEPEDQVRGDWLWHGANTGRIGKSGQSTAGKPGGQSYFDWWLSLVIP